jgi:ParB family transcriptional regulator, chromosome partitioning protein
MAKAQEIRDVKMADLIIGKSQVRVKDVGKEIDELAESIRVQGLLQPIVVIASDKKGKYEIVTGQRRYLACKQLKIDVIKAVVLGDKIDEAKAKAISVTENLVRRNLSQKELIDACTALFNKYGSIKVVCEETGLPRREVTNYVKYDRLVEPLQKMVKDGELDMKTALRAQDAAGAGSDDKPDPKAIVKLAQEMKSMTGAQQKKLIQIVETETHDNVDDVIESAKSGAKVKQIVVTLTDEIHKSLQEYAKSDGVNQDEAASTLIEDGLLGKGFGGK